MAPPVCAMSFADGLDEAALTPAGEESGGGARPGSVMLGLGAARSDEKA